MKTIGEFLSECRKAHGFTQREVADRLNISNRTVSAWERGKVMPDILLLPALAELYGVTADEILAGAKQPKSPPAEAERSSPEPLHKIAAFTMWAAILTAVFAVSYAMLFAGWYLDVQYLHTFYRELCLSLLYIGLALSLLCIVFLTIVWRRWETGADAAVRLALRRRVFLCACVWAGLSILFATVAAVPLGKACLGKPDLASDTLIGWIWDVQFRETIAGYAAMVAVFLFFAAVAFVAGFILLKRAEKKFSPQGDARTARK